MWLHETDVQEEENQYLTLIEKIKTKNFMKNLIGASGEGQLCLKCQESLQMKLVRANRRKIEPLNDSQLSPTSSFKEP